MLEVRVDDSIERGTRVLHLLDQLEAGPVAGEIPGAAESLPTPVPRLPHDRRCRGGRAGGRPGGGRQEEDRSPAARASEPQAGRRAPPTRPVSDRPRARSICRPTSRAFRTRSRPVCGAARRVLCGLSREPRSRRSGGGAGSGAVRGGRRRIGHTGVRRRRAGGLPVPARHGPFQGRARRGRRATT